MNPKDEILKYNRFRLRHDCDRSGCFNEVHRPKLEAFGGCFGGDIRFSDVDGLVEINRHFLFLEWKSHRGAIPTGQRILYERLTAFPNVSVICVCGDPATMEITASATFERGEFSGWSDTSFEDVWHTLREWRNNARADFRNTRNRTEHKP